MTFSPVAWAHGDVATSAKLAQMEENVRTHDHRTTDQGGNLGARELASGEATVMTAGLGASTQGTEVVNLPAGRFANVPRVYASIKGGGQVRHRRVLARNPSTSSFTVVVYAGASAIAAPTGVTITWIAVDAP